MRARVQRWGNSLALRIPKSAAEACALESGAEVDLSLDEGRLIVTPVPPRYTLNELLAGVTDENLHGEMGPQGSVGLEAW
ncbi:AbrB/MazE/SpoVT family DNA-binding domain-containing protein [Longimicrobium sp.]|uniref:AbrB/MazE/SpoVT family DNA-binding domain-containing protein n=1 Tax=Longimicrobium sp. TaxID=2029185 RepID=UPI002E446209|nr:AbrB/MazE/SpoVT family DNA-binding domain-containing protein [Longimicrobium sp.]